MRFEYFREYTAPKVVTESTVRIKQKNDAKDVRV